MHLATLNVEHTTSRSTARLRDAAIFRGHSITLLAATDLTLALNEGGAVALCRREPLPQFDGIIPRVSAASDPFGLSVLEHFESSGVTSLNVSKSIYASHDKLHTLRLLRQNGIPIPPTVAVHRPNELANALQLLGESPVVVKTVLGSQGVGVMLAETRASAIAIAETMLANRLPVLIQRFFGEAEGTDIRAFVVGDTVAAAMRRTARPGEFRSNLHRGGSAQPVVLEPALQDLARRSTHALGLRVAGVDIIETRLGPLVLEVNSSPGLSGIEAATGVDVATPIITLLEALISDSRRS
jgi:ribosomal protein S6--L-glutamate ligase